MSTRKQKVLDVVERAAWTLLQAGTGEAIVLALDIPQLWAVPIAGALAGIKGYFATKFGDGSAATLPATQGRHAAPEVEL